MAQFSLESATGKLTFITGVNDEGEVVFKAKSYRHINVNATADQLSTGFGALADLSQYDLHRMEKIETSSVQA